MISYESPITNDPDVKIALALMLQFCAAGMQLTNRVYRSSSGDATTKLWCVKLCTGAHKNVFFEPLPGYSSDGTELTENEAYHQERCTFVIPTKHILAAEKYLPGFDVVEKAVRKILISVCDPAHAAYLYLFDAHGLLHGGLRKGAGFGDHRDNHDAFWKTKAFFQSKGFKTQEQLDSVSLKTWDAKQTELSELEYTIVLCLNDLAQTSSLSEMRVIRKDITENYTYQPFAGGMGIFRSKQRHASVEPELGQDDTYKMVYFYGVRKTRRRTRSATESDATTALGDASPDERSEVHARNFARNTEIVGGQSEP